MARTFLSHHSDRFMKTGKSEVIIILDRSGSMSSIAGDMEGGFKTFVEKQKKEPGECLVSLYQFDDVFETIYEARNLQQIDGLTLSPRNSTALHDAVGRTINLVGDRLAKTSEADRPESVIILTITDGQENASKEFTATQVAKMVKHQTDKYNWKFVFLGANIDAVTTGGNLGYVKGRSLTFGTSTAAVSSTWSVAASGVSCLRASAASDYAFTEQERQDALVGVPPTP